MSEQANEIDFFENVTSMIKCCCFPPPDGIADAVFDTIEAACMFVTLKQNEGLEVDESVGAISPSERIPATNKVE